MHQEFEGDSKVKLQSLKRDFENEKMKENESLNEYFNRLSKLVNQMKSHGDTIDYHNQNNDRILYVTKTIVAKSLVIEFLFGCYLATYKAGRKKIKFYHYIFGFYFSWDQFSNQKC